MGESDKADRTAQRKLRAAARLAKRRLPSHLPPVLFLTDPVRTPDPGRIADRLPRDWGIVYRHFGAPDRFSTAKALAKIARRRGLVLFIAADPKLARAVRADGVHWPERLARQGRSTPSRLISTCSAHSRMALARAQGNRAAAAILSTAFESRSPSAGKPMGPLRFRRLAAMSKIPVYALGGVHAVNAGRIGAPFAAIDGVSTCFSR